MSIPAAANYVTATGNGVTTVWPYTFLIPDDDSITVTLYDTVTNDETILVEGTDYTASAYDNPLGGNVTYPLSGTPIAATVKITIRATPPIEQVYEPAPQGGFSPASLEDQLDRMTIMIQEVSRLAGQALTIPQAETGFTNEALVLALINFIEGSSSVINLAQTLIPAAHNTYDIGSSAVRWKNGYFEGFLRVSNATDTGSGDVVTRGATQTLSAKTLATPTITGVATHTDSGAAVMQQLTNTSAGATGVMTEKYANSASPANADVVLQEDGTFNSSTAVKRTGFRKQVRIDDVTNASEDTSVIWSVIKAGTLSSILLLGQLASGTAQADTIGVPGGKVSMPATQNADSGANVWDDYEEGTGTPALGGSTTYTTQNMKYTKNGDDVSIALNLAVNVLGTGSTTTMSGLPFTSNGTVLGFAIAFARFATLAVSPVFITGFIAASVATMTTSDLTAAAASTTSDPALYGNGANIRGGGHYAV